MRWMPNNYSPNHITLCSWSEFYLKPTCQNFMRVAGLFWAWAGCRRQSLWDKQPQEYGGYQGRLHPFPRKRGKGEVWVRNGPRLSVSGSLLQKKKKSWKSEVYASFSTVAFKHKCKYFSEKKLLKALCWSLAIKCTYQEIKYMTFLKYT